MGISQAQTTKFTNHNEIGVITYGPVFLESGLAIRSFNGIHVGDHYATGVTIEVSRFPVNEDRKFWSVPLSAKGRYYFNPKRRISIFSDLDIGYNFTFLNGKNKIENEMYRYRGGLFVNPQLGLRLKSPHRDHFWTLSLGYRFQQFRETHFSNYTYTAEKQGPIADDNRLEGYDYRQDNKYLLHRVAIMFGFGF